MRRDGSLTIFQYLNALRVSGRGASIEPTFRPATRLLRPIIQISPFWLGLVQSGSDAKVSCRSQQGVGMTDDLADEPPAAVKIVKLTTRDVGDARRLLSLLASDDERIVIEPPPGRDRSVFPSQKTLLAKALELIGNRRSRQDIFGKAMFGEPPWDMLLHLYVVDTGQRQSVGRLADLAGATRSTALRWIDYLEHQQLVSREAHPTDRRAVFVELTAKGREALELYLSGIIQTETQMG